MRCDALRGVASRGGAARRAARRCGAGRGAAQGNGGDDALRGAARRRDAWRGDATRGGAMRSENHFGNVGKVGGGAGCAAAFRGARNTARTAPSMLAFSPIMRPASPTTWCR